MQVGDTYYVYITDFLTGSKYKKCKIKKILKKIVHVSFEDKSVHSYEPKELITVEKYTIIERRLSAKAKFSSLFNECQNLSTEKLEKVCSLINQELK